jgi:hypothetical protein
MNSTQTIPKPSEQKYSGFTSHAGLPLPNNADFCILAPAEIGKVISAQTTLSKMSNPMQSEVRWGTIIATVFFTSLFLSLSKRDTFGGCFTGVSFGIGIWFFTRFHHTFSYVGTKGFCKYTLTGSRSARPKQKSLLLFANNQNLYTSTTRQYINGIYAGTDCQYNWATGIKSNYLINSRYYNEHQMPNANSDWHFANSAEIAWTEYLLNNIDNQMQKNGYLECRSSGG